MNYEFTWEDALGDGKHASDHEEDERSPDRKKKCKREYEEEEKEKDDHVQATPVNVDEESIPEIVVQLMSEESEGKFRRLTGHNLFVVTQYYRKVTHKRFVYFNPLLDAPGREFVVILGSSVSDDNPTIFSYGYVRIAESVHGNYVECRPNQLALKMSEMSQQRTVAFTTEYRWLGLKFRGSNIYFAGSELPSAEGKTPLVDTTATVRKKKSNKAKDIKQIIGQQALSKFFPSAPQTPQPPQQTPEEPDKKPGGPRLHPEFARGVFYVSVMDTFALEKSAYIALLEKKVASLHPPPQPPPGERTEGRSAFTSTHPN